MSISAVGVQEIAKLDITRRGDLDFPWRPDIMRLHTDIDYAVDQYGGRLVTQAMLAAIIDRESNFRNIFQEGMPHAYGCGVGPCQITSGVDWTNPDNPTFGGLDMTVPRNNMIVAVRDFLVPAIREFDGDHQAAFDAYNLGGGGVANEILSGESPDKNTTGGNYGRSVFQTWITYASIIYKVPVDWTTWVPK